MASQIEGMVMPAILIIFNHMKNMWAYTVWPSPVTTPHNAKFCLFRYRKNLGCRYAISVLRNVR